MPFRVVKYLHYLLACGLHHIDQVDLLKLTVIDESRYFVTQILVLLRGVREVPEILPKLAPILKVNKKLRQIGRLALLRITQHLPGPIFRKLDKDGRVAALTVGYGLRIYITQYLT